MTVALRIILSLALILFSLPLFSEPVVADVQHYSIQTESLSGIQSCRRDDNGPYTYDECQANLKYKLTPASGIIPASCRAYANGTLTFEECQNQIHQGKKYRIGKLNQFSKDSCIEDRNGSFTWEECNTQLHAGKKYKIIKTEVFGAPSFRCVQDNQNGIYTWDECQNEVKNNPNPTATETTGENPCASVDPSGTRVLEECPTAVGDIPTDPQSFINTFLSIVVSIAGGIAIILMVIGAIRIITSSGDQQKLSGGRDQFVAAVAGLLFLIFSVLILRFIGISILGL